VLASGRASTHGQARFDGKAAADKQVSFKGGFAVDDLLLKESETGERFLAWKRLSSDTVSATPGGLDIDELKLDGLGAKLYARLLDKETVSDEALKKLAERRGQVIVEGLASAGAPRERIQAAAIEAFQGEGKEVPAKLELGVAGKR